MTDPYKDQGDLQHQDPDGVVNGEIVSEAAEVPGESSEKNHAETRAETSEKTQEEALGETAREDLPGAGNEPNPKQKKEKKKRTLGQEILSWAGTLLLAVVLAMTIRALLFEPIRVDGESMLETLQDREIVLVTKPAVLLNKLKRGDVVIVRFPNRSKTTALRLGAPLDLEFVSHQLFVKRLVALPGDSVAVLNGQLVVNDAIVQEDYIDYPPRQDYPRRVLGPDEYMVMGDNRASSHDSRSADVGPISKSMIVGKAAFVLLPLNKIRSIH